MRGLSKVTKGETIKFPYFAAGESSNVSKYKMILVIGMHVEKKRSFSWLFPESNFPVTLNVSQTEAKRG